MGGVRQGTQLVVGEETRTVLRVGPSPVVELRGRIGMARVSLDVFQACTVLKCGGDEGGTHRVSAEASPSAERRAYLRRMRSTMSGHRTPGLPS